MFHESMSAPELLNVNVGTTGRSICNLDKTIDGVGRGTLVVEDYFVVLVVWPILAGSLLNHGVEQDLLDLVLILRLRVLVIVVKAFLYMDAVESELHIRPVVLLSQLKIQLVLPYEDLGVYLFLGLHFGELPVNNAYLVFIPQEQVEPLVYFLCLLSHPLLRTHYQVVIFNHLLANDKSQGVDGFIKLIWKFYLGTVSNYSPFEGTGVPDIPISLYEILHQAMQPDALFLGTYVLVTLLLRQKAKMPKKVMTIRLPRSLQLINVHSWILLILQIEYVNLNWAIYNLCNVLEILEYLGSLALLTYNINHKVYYFVLWQHVPLACLERWT